MQAESAKVVDKEGNVLDVIDDEAVVDNDEEGNTKVDENGNLQGRREYRVRTFKIVGKEDRLYMLSTEPARCCGFRDSYLFFTKHPKLYKVVLGEEQKKELIRRDILPSSYKGRNIGVVTARSVFREFGSRIIVGGRKVIDDYKVEEAKANGEVEGELADPADRVPNNHDDYNRNRYVAWFGASDIYRQPAGAGSGAAGKPGMPWKRKSNVTRENWQLMHAREARYVLASSQGQHWLTDVRQSLQLCDHLTSPRKSQRCLRNQHQHDVLPTDNATNSCKVGTRVCDRRSDLIKAQVPHEWRHRISERCAQSTRR